MWLPRPVVGLLLAKAKEVGLLHHSNWSKTEGTELNFNYTKMKRGMNTLSLLIGKWPLKAIRW
jgi:hypothetical protein